MKYLKSFESINEGKPQVGDYILVKPGLWKDQIFKIIEIRKSGESTLGKYVYVVKDDKTWYEPLKFVKKEILYWTKTPEELETIISASKYNL